MRHVFSRGAGPFSDGGTEALEDAPGLTSARDRPGSFVDGAFIPGRARPRDAAAAEGRTSDGERIHLRRPSPGLAGISSCSHAELPSDRQLPQ